MIGNFALSEKQAALRRLTLLVGAAMLCPFFLVDYWVGRNIALVWAIRAVWTAVVAAAALLPERPEPLATNERTLAVAAVSGASTFAIIAVSSGTDSLYFGFLYALPLGILVLLPEAPLCAMVAGAITFVGGVVILESEGRGVQEVVQFAATHFASALLAIYGTFVNRGIWHSEVEAERERRRALEKLGASERLRARSERLALVGQLAAGVAHEVNNPLSFVTANLGWLQAEHAAGRLAGSTEGAVALREALVGVVRIQQIVSDLRSFARDAVDEVEPCPVEDLVEEAVRLSSVRLKKIPVERRIESGLPQLVLNRRRLLQVLVNLLVNAADAVEDPAAARPGRLPGVRIEAAVEGHAVTLAVEDGGPGIPDEVAPHLFEPFFSTKGARGTGLGLALSREYVTRLGGTLHAHNVPGAGARFVIRIPIARTAPEAGVAA